MIQRIIILGAGAIGGSVGALLHRAGIDVAFVARGEHLEAIRRAGLRLRMPSGEFCARCATFGRTADVNWSAGDLAVLATKLQDAEPILDELRNASGPTLPVVCMTNGLHGEKLAVARFDTVLSTMVWMPATHLEPGEVRLHTTACPGVLDTGAASERGLALAEAFCRVLTAAGFDAIAREDIARWNAAKLITNLGGAAQAMVKDDWQRVAAAARAEGTAVLDAAAIDRVPEDEFAERVAAIDCVAVAGEERGGGSTWQSRQRDKPLESPWIEGAIAAIAESCGVPAPINALLAALARAPREVSAVEVLAADE
ncbi:MAG: ketopantoate reductase family protein [bacterium]|nr:ketopantoate reductase family protein [bacterium]